MQDDIVFINNNSNETHVMAHQKVFPTITVKLFEYFINLLCYYIWLGSFY